MPSPPQKTAEKNQTFVFKPVTTISSLTHHHPELGVAAECLQ